MRKWVSIQEFERKVSHLREEMDELRTMFFSLDKSIKAASTAEQITQATNDELRARKRQRYGAQLRALRKSMNLTQYEFAKRFGISQGLVTMCEAGRRSASKLLRKIREESTRSALKEAV